MHSNNDKAQPIIGIVLTVLSLVLLVGVNTFAGPCGVHDDGSVSSCFWAARAVTGEAIVCAVLALVRIFERDEGERRGLSLACGLLGALIASTPGALINLCMMQTMRCHTIMNPFVTVAGAIIAVVGCADLIVRLRALTRGR